MLYYLFCIYAMLLRTIQASFPVHFCFAGRQCIGFVASGWFSFFPSQMLLSY